MAKQHYDSTNKFTYTVDSNGEYHSYNDKPAIEYLDDKTKIWMTHGEMDRDYKKGPALISNTKECYYKNGLLHHPYDYAVKYNNGKKEYHYNGIEYLDYYKNRSCFINDDTKLHGGHQRRVDNKIINELYVDGCKTEYNELPVIINKDEYVTYIFGYCFMINTIYEYGNEERYDKYRKHNYTMQKIISETQKVEFYPTNNLSDIIVYNMNNSYYLIEYNEENSGIVKIDNLYEKIKNNVKFNLKIVPNDIEFNIKYYNKEYKIFNNKPKFIFVESE